jgi:uracil-DNA glycosylase
LLRPRLIVPVGGIAARRLLGLKSVSECVGRRFEHGEATAIPLPHPSGASGWLNDAANRRRVGQAARMIREELGQLGCDSERR